jgi:hypothetical protein
LSRATARASSARSWPEPSGTGGVQASPIGLCFDFPWTNRTAMFGSYERTVSFFQKTDLMATGKPSANRPAPAASRPRRRPRPAPAR